MQKKLIALAVASLAAGSVFAQSNVTISGYVSQGYSNYKTNDAGSKTEHRLDDGRYSRIRFTGTEDLGNGLKAEFQFETRLSLETGADAGAISAFGSGDQFVGLSGSFGRVRLGRMDTYYSDGVLTELTRATSFQDHATLSLLTQTGADAGPLATNIRQGRFNNQIRYDSPNFSGFSGTLAYMFAPDGNEASGATPAANNTAVKNNTWYAAARYFAGPIYVGASYYNEKNKFEDIGRVDSGTQDIKAYRAYGSYTFPFGLKVGLNIDRTSWDVAPVGATPAGALAARRTAWFIPVTYSFGSHAVYATYGKAGDRKNAAGNVNSSGAKFYKVAYDYALSKRTSVGANYTVIKNEDNASYGMFGTGGFFIAGTDVPAAGSKAKQLYIGVNHSF